MNKDKLISFLSTLVEFDTSINPGKNLFPTSDCAEFLHQHANQHGYEVLSPNNCYYNGNPDNPLYPVLVVKRGTKPGKNVLFLGHIDVVPVSDAEIPDWDHPPFKAELEGDLLHGRGSGDMKGGVSAFFAAFDNLEFDKGNLIIALSGDEEIGGLDTVPQMIEVLDSNGLRPDYVINAEGSSTPVIVTKRRGGTQIKYTFDLDYDRINGKSAVKKFQSSIGDGSKGLHSMSYLLGSSSHAMITAGVYTMDKPISHIQSSSSKNNAVPKEVTVAYVDENPEWSEEIMYSKGLTGVLQAIASIGSVPLPIVRSKFGPSICPNLIEVDKESETGTLTFDIRAMLSSMDAHEKVAETIQEHFKAYGVDTEYEIELQIDPVNVDPETELAVLTEDIAEKHGFNIQSRGEKLGGASDTRFFTSLEIPGIELGPLAKNAHGMNETVDISSILLLKNIYRELFLSLQVTK